MVHTQTDCTYLADCLKGPEKVGEVGGEEGKIGTELTVIQDNKIIICTKTFAGKHITHIKECKEKKGKEIWDMLFVS
jgi:hypothetical protein